MQNHYLLLHLEIGLSLYDKIISMHLFNFLVKKCLSQICHVKTFFVFTAYLFYCLGNPLVQPFGDTVHVSSLSHSIYTCFPTVYRPSCLSVYFYFWLFCLFSYVLFTYFFFKLRSMCVVISLAFFFNFCSYKIFKLAVAVFCI